MNRISAIACLFPLMLGLGALPACASSIDPDAMDFAMHDVVYTTFHEMGHMFVSEFELPVLGKEEDAADALAAVQLLGPDADEDWGNALISAADEWYFSAVKSTGSTLEDLSYYDDHALDIERAYAMVCMMVGADPEWFGDVAEAYDMDADRQEACKGVYEQAATSWTSVLEPYLADGQEGAAITVVYDETKSYSPFRKELQKRGILENIAERVQTTYVLPRPITIRATECGEANAYFSADDAEITYCYELAKAAYDMYINDIPD